MAKIPKTKITIPLMVITSIFTIALLSYFPSDVSAEYGKFTVPEISGTITITEMSDGYSNDAKMRELGVEKSAFDEGEAGAVSHEVAVQMARGARYQSGSDVSIAITGIAGPGGSTADKEVGRVHVAVIARDYFLVRRMDFGNNDRLDNKRSFAVFALRLALETLDRLEDQENVSEDVEDNSDDNNLGISEMDPSSEEWAGSMSWNVEETTVADEIQKVDLASLTDWDE